MKRHALRGVSTVEFAFSLLLLVPLVLGTGAIGVNLIRTLQTIQLARDAGHMFATQVDFSINGTTNGNTPGTGNQAVLGRLGASLGLNTTASNLGRAVVILSALTYVDDNTCGAAAGTAPNKDCGNYGHWVFVQRLVLGKASMRTSNYGSPIINGTDIPNNVTLDSHGRIDVTQYANLTGARANFSNANGIIPYQVVNGKVSGLPSGQRVYLAEAASLGWAMAPYAGGYPTYSFTFF